MNNDTLTSRIDLSVSVEVTRPRAASWDMDAVASRVLYDLPPVETTTSGNGESYPVTVRIVGASCDRWGEREYMRDVRALADEVRERWQGDPRGFDASDATWEAVDGSAWVIYYAGQRAVIRWTENIDAADDVGDLGRDVQEAITRIAFYAMCADVKDALRREYGDPEGWTTDDEDDTGDEPYPRACAAPTHRGFLARYDPNLNDTDGPVYTMTESGIWWEGYDVPNPRIFEDAEDAVAVARSWSDTGGR